MCAQSRFEFSLAEEADDEALRILLRQVAMPGDITLSFQREPSFFLAEQAGNRTSQVIVCRDRQKDRIVGMGSRSTRLAFIDGQPAHIGYLSMLRGIPEVRGNIALARGYRYLQTLHADGTLPYYFTTILDENTQAKALLTGRRAGLPVYQPVAHLITYLIPLAGRWKSKKMDNAVRRIDQEQLPEAVAFLQNWNSRYQFAPVYTLEDFLAQNTLLPFFSWDNIYLYRENGRVSGILGIWDQKAFKQTIVGAYARKLQVIRPFYNLYASIKGEPILPPAGASIKFVYALFVSGNKNVFEALLNQVGSDWSGKGFDYLCVGICQGNELSSTAFSYATQQISSTVYLVYWQEKDVQSLGLDRPVHLDIATL